MEYQRKIFDQNIMDIKKENKTGYKRILFFAILLSVICTIVFLYIFLNNYSAAVDDYRLVVVRRGTIQKTIQFDGEVGSTGTSYVKARLEGTLEKVYVHPGEEVSANTVLAVIQTDQYEKQLRDMSLELKDLNAKLTEQQLNNQMILLNFQYGLSDLEGEKEKIEKELSLKEELYKCGSISQSEYEEFLHELGRMKNDVEYYAQKFQLEEKINKNKILTIQNQIDSLNAKISDVNEKIINKNIVSPYKGIIKEVSFQEGSYVYENSNCFMISQNDKYDFIVKVPQKNLNDIKINQKIVVLFKNGEQCQSTVTAIDNIIISNPENNYNYTPVMIQPIEPVNIKLMAGVAFTAKAVLEEKENILVIKREDFIPESSMRYVYRVVENGKSAVKTDIDAGISDDRYIEILSGLNEGDQVVVSDYAKFSDRQKVRLK